MPWICDCSPTKGKTEPASAFLSPVARDYPNRALRRFFHAGGASTVPSKNGRKRSQAPGEVTFLFFTTYSPVVPVNNLTATLPTGCSRGLLRCPVI
jgi:hypothetical protein